MTSTDVVSPPAAEHSLALSDVVLLLGSDPVSGLDEAEARQRLQRFGPNALAVSRRTRPVIRLLRQFASPLIYVLLAAGAVTFALGETVDSAVIFGVVLTNALVGYLEESKAETAMDALRSLARTEARVVRDGRTREIPSEDLVPGDVILVQEGDKVPADARLIRLSELRVDESALTGESQPGHKDAAVLPAETSVADRRNMLYSGTLVTSGSGTGVVVRTGGETEIGEIHRLVGAADQLATPLTRKIGRFSTLLTVVILALAAVTFAVGILRGDSVVEVFTAAVALAVGAIPEGLPAAITITLAIGMARMAKHRAVIRRLPAVETLGSVTVICTDKTGTLTENQMTVRALWTPDGSYQVTGAGYGTDGAVLDASGRPVDASTDSALRWSLLAGAGCNDAVLTTRDGRPAVVGDPTEGAMLVVARKAARLLDTDASSLPRLETLPFTSHRGYMATLHADRGGRRRVVLVKGAVERVLPLCGTRMGADGDARPLDPAAALAAAERLAADGMRVLATAVLVVDEDEDVDVDPRSLDGTLVLTGLQAMLDPPRPAAAAAVRACATAGIAVKMITGDHAGTATAIALQLGLLPRRHPGDVLTGTDLAALPEADYTDAVERASVFARVSPEQKLHLVRALQGRGHVVAMTGDGVNDAPALRQADIGVSMGRGGTEVAKDASDMVLSDDDFSTIEAAVEEGRGVFDNLTKFIVWTLPTNIGEGLVILVAIALGTTLPILPTQILWINMTTAVALGLMLAFEPKERDIMRRPPRDPNRPLLTRSLMARILLVSGLLVGATWLLFHWLLADGTSVAEARTAAVNLFVAVEVFYLFSCRSLTSVASPGGPLGNRWLLGGVAVQAVGQLALTYVPVMNQLFRTSPLTADTWLRVLLLTAAVSLVISVDKRVRGGRF